MASTSGIRTRPYRYLLTGVLLGLAVSLGTMVQSVPAERDVVRTGRLEVVDPAGRVVIAADAQANGGVVRLWNDRGTLGLGLYGSDKGGHLRVLNSQGQAVFTAGIAPENDFPTLWERQVHMLERLEQEVDRLRQELRSVNLQSRAPQSQQHLGSTLDRLQQQLGMQRRDLDQQRREIDRQRREINSLERQVRSLERR